MATRQLAASPPGALDDMREHCATLEETIRELEGKNETLRREAARWRERARNAIASERLTQLQSGPRSVPLSPRLGGSQMTGASPRAASAAGSPRAAALPVTPMFGCASTLGGTVAPVGSGGAAGGMSSEDLARLHAELEWHKTEAEHERARQRAFLEALWRSEKFTQVQKVRAAELLREQVDAAEAEAQRPEIPEPVKPMMSVGGGGGGSSPLVGNLALSRPRRA